MDPSMIMKFLPMLAGMGGKKEEKEKLKFGDDNYLSNLQAQTANRPSGIELIQKLRKKRSNGNY